MKLKFKALFYLLPILVCGLVIFGVSTYSQENLKDDTVIAKINTESITYRELKAFMDQNRGEIHSYFHSKYEITDAKNFWTTSFDGEVPIDHLREKALEELTQIKVQQQMGKEYGLLEDITYEAFLNRWKAENVSRKAAVKNNEVIYGPVHYSEMEYFHYEFNNLILSIQEEMKRSSDLSEERLMKLYEEHKETRYKRTPTVEITLIKASYLDGRGAVDHNERDQYKKRLESYKNELEKDLNLKDIEQKLTEPFTVEKRIFNEETREMDVRYDQELINQIMLLESGDYSEVFEDSVSGVWYLAYCNAKEAKGFEPFEQVAGDLKGVYVQQLYNDEIQKRLSKVKVEKLQSFYEIKTN